jgi:hypothetical protein
MRGIVDEEYMDGEVRGLVFVCGTRGMGKTCEMIRRLDTCTGGVLFFDTLSKHHSKFHNAFTVFTPELLVTYLRMNRGRRFRVLYQPRFGDMDEHFAQVCTIVRAFGWMIFAVDELDMHCGARFGDRRMSPEFYHLVHYGRHERVSMVATARDPMGVPRAYTGQAEMLLFRIEEESYRDYFKDRIGKEAATRLASLPQFFYLYKVPGSEPILRGGVRPGV